MNLGLEALPDLHKTETAFYRKYLAFPKSVQSGDERPLKEDHPGCSAPLGPVGRDRQYPDFARDPRGPGAPCWQPW